MARKERGVDKESMGEIDFRRRFNFGGIRGSIVKRLAAPEIAQLQQFEDDFAETVERLQRVKQQRDQLRDDIGVYRTTWSNLGVGDYNPEEISYDEYKKMLNYDSQVIAGWDLITMGMLMKPWTIKHPDPKIAVALTEALNRLQMPNIRDAMKEMTKAIAYGFSTTEVVFEEWNNMWVPRQKNGLKTLDPEHIKFFSDQYGNLVKIEQQMGGARNALPLFRTLVWVHEKEWGNFYGKSILRGCYKNWFIKDAMLKFANIAYERFGSPALLGIARNIAEKDEMLEQLMHLYARSQAVLVKSDNEDPTDVKVIETKRNQMPFDRYINYQDEMILRRMLIGQRIFEGGGGTYGPKIPFDIILMRFMDFRLELEGTMNQLLMLLTDLNWPTDTYPRFEFEPLTTMDAEQLRSAIWEAMDRKLLDPESKKEDERFVKETLGLPYQSGDDKIDEEEKDGKEVFE